MIVLKRETIPAYVSGMGKSSFRLTSDLNKARKFKDAAEMIEFVSTYSQTYLPSRYIIVRVEPYCPQWKEVGVLGAAFP